MRYKLTDLIDIPKNQELLNSFCDAIGIAAAIIDLQGKVLVGSRWQRICTDFHRINEQACARCIESDTVLANELGKGKQFSIYSCKNGLTDAASPIIIEGEHVANVFVGQFLVEPPDTEYFLLQAERYGFEKTSYLDALSSVPIVSKKKLSSILDFLTSFAQTVANMGLKQSGILEAKEALADSEAFLRSLVQTIPDLVWLKDPQGIYLACNSRFESFFGAKEEDIIGKTDYDFVDRELADFFRNNDKVAIAKGKPSQNEEEITFSDDGHREILETIKTPMFRSDGQLAGVLGIGRNITERKQAEEALRKNKAQLSNAMEIAKLGYWEYDVASNLFTFNDHFYSIFRTSAEQVGGYMMTPDRYAEFFLHPEDKYLVGEEMRKALDTTDPNYSRQLEHRIVYADGETGYIAVRFFIVKDDQGRTIKTYGANQDITARKRVEEEKRVLESRLRQAHKMEAIGTLAGGIAHDFNNILTPILVHTELALLDMPDKSTIRNSLEEIEKAGHRAKDLVKQILTYSRQTERQTVSIDLATIVKESVKLLRASLPTTIEIRHSIEEGLGNVWGDPTQIHQVVMNLCTNAAQVMKEMGSVLEVALESVDFDKNAVKDFCDITAGRYIMLKVSDTGSGIAPDVMDKIFDPFFTTKPAGEGTGMGLAVVHGIVQSHGGTIKVDTKPGEGTTFKVFFPRVEKEVEPGRKRDEKLPTGDERILFVDDEESLVILGRQMLERLGYKVEARTSSIEALAAFQNHPDRYDLVVTDMTMPNMTGEKLAKELLRIRPDIPIIICTGFSQQMDQKKAYNMGIRAFVMKPFVIRDVAQTVRRVLDTSTG